jgi:hypothetical protein
MELLAGTRTASLPPLYAAWIDELLNGPIPSESEATCSSCAMCDHSGGVQRNAEHFNPHTKCCTYMPDLPNFLVGRSLADEDPLALRGRATVEARIATRAAVTPLGLRRPRPYNLLYRSSTDAFGHSLAMRCPHYIDEQGGLCGVWKNRNAMCSTWFCKHVRGALGQHFWKSIYRVLFTLERTLASWCVFELDPGRESLERLFPSSNGNAPELDLDPFELDGTADPYGYQALWGRFTGREAEFYRACAERVSKLSFKEVLVISGAELRTAAHLARLAYAELVSDDLPETLQLGPFHVVSSDCETMRVSTYSDYDPLEIPRALADLLHRFDGRPVSTVLETIATGDNVDLDPATVRKLADFKILQP